MQLESSIRWNSLACWVIAAIPYSVHCSSKFLSIPTLLFHLSTISFDIISNDFSMSSPSCASNFLLSSVPRTPSSRRRGRLAVCPEGFSPISCRPESHLPHSHVLRWKMLSSLSMQNYSERLACIHRRSVCPSSVSVVACGPSGSYAGNTNPVF